MSSFVIMPAAAAQDDEATAEQGGIAEIVVTAQRRDENVQDVPIAISAFSAEQMEAHIVSKRV